MANGERTKTTLPPLKPAKAGLTVKDIASVPRNSRELRFTRNAAGAGLLIMAALCGGASLMCYVICSDALISQMLMPLWVMELIGLSATAINAYLGLYCLRIAYIIVSPVGIEILPFRNPRHTMRLYMWHDLLGAEFNDREMVLHHCDDTYEHLSLLAMNPRQRKMLRRAVTQRLHHLLASFPK